MSNQVTLGIFVKFSLQSVGGNIEFADTHIGPLELVLSIFNLFTAYAQVIGFWSLIIRNICELLKGKRRTASNEFHCLIYINPRLSEET